MLLQDVCEILKNAVRTLLSDCASLMTDISSLVINMYQSHPHPVILDISKQVCHRNYLLSVLTNLMSIRPCSHRCKFELPVK